MTPYVHLLLVLKTSLAVYSSSVCPVDKFQVQSITDICSSDTCIGDCYNLFTCCVGLCFSLDLTASLTEICNIMESDEGRGCSTYVEEMICLANITNSTPTICHEQLIWMESEGIASFQLSPLHHCPCESGYHRVDGICNYNLCQNATDCVNTTDTFYNTNVCCYNDYLKPTGDICNAGQEIAATIITSNQTDCNDTCTSISGDYTCMTSDHTFPACCTHKKILLTPNEKKDPLELADGVIVILVILFGFVLISAALFIGVFFYKRRYAIKNVDGKFKIPCLKSVEEDTHKDDWTNCTLTDNVKVPESINSISEISSNNTAEVTVEINHNGNGMIPDTTTLEGQFTSHNEYYEAYGSKTQSSEIIDTGQQRNQQTNQYAVDVVNNSANTDVLQTVAKAIHKPQLNDEPLYYSNMLPKTDSSDRTDDMIVRTHNSSLSGYSDSEIHINDLDTSFESETDFYLPSRSNVDFTRDRSYRSSTPLSLVCTASIGDTTDDNMSVADM